MPVISPRRSSATSSSFYVMPTSSSVSSTELSGTSSYLDRGNSQSKASPTSYSSSYGHLNFYSYTPRTTSTYRSSGSSSATSYSTGGFSKYSSYRSPSTYLSSNNDSALSSRYGLKSKSNIPKDPLRNHDGNHETSKSSNSGSDGSKSTNLLSSSYSSSSLARLVATSGLDLYEKYSPAHYIPKCELARSRNSVSETVSSAADNKIADESVKDANEAIKSKTPYRPFNSKQNRNDDGAVPSATSKRTSKPIDKSLNFSSSSSSLKCSFNNTTNTNNNSSINKSPSDDAIPTYTVYRNRLRRSAASTNADGDDENVLKNGSTSVNNSYSNSNSTDRVTATRNHLKDLNLSESSLLSAGDYNETTHAPNAAATITITNCRNASERNGSDASTTAASKLEAIPSVANCSKKVLKFSSGSSMSELSATGTERQREDRNIDPSSIKASIEKFNSLSKQKRIPSPLSTTTLRSQGRGSPASGSGSGSTSNLQHNRYSSDFSDTYNARLQNTVVSGGSLTRFSTRNYAANFSANKVVTNVYASSSSSTTPVAVKTKMHFSSNPSGVGSSVPPVRGSGNCNRSTESSPTHSSSTTTTTATPTTSCKILPRTTTEHSNYNGNSLASSNNSECNENKLLNNSCDSDTDDSSVRSSSALRSALPPPSPTSSRYRDRDINRTATSSYDSPYTNASQSSGEKSEGLCGLRNIGNTCFMNSVIQCLSHTSELTKFLRTLNGVKSANSKDQQILYEFAKLIREMWTANVNSVTPLDLKRAFSTKHRMYSDYNQQDAQEFLRFFLDTLHGALNSGVKGGDHLKVDDNLNDNKKADLTWEWYTRHENSLIRDLFVGQLKSTLKCTACGNTSVTFDPFWDLSVSLPSSSRCKLDTCLDLFIREEILDGDEMPTCSKCHTRRRSTKSFSIQRFPKYLVIHLKRFSETRWSKLSNIVEFPTGERQLNMGPYGSNHNSNAYYSLYGISNHMGSTAGGHYVALCKHPISKKWHEFNDNIVSEDLPESHLVSSSAYILFYERA